MANEKLMAKEKQILIPIIPTSSPTVPTFPVLFDLSTK